MGQSFWLSGYGEFDMKAKVSIIVPVYNVEKYLKECVDSIRNQTMKEMEIILIDDGSTDNCLQMCERFAAEDDRISVFHQANAGVSEARNRGMKMVCSDWVMFVDPDDWLEADAVEALYRQANKSDYDIVCGSFYENRTDAEVIQTKPEKEYSDEEDHKFFIAHQLRFEPGDGVFVSSWGKIYRKKMLDQYDCRFPKGVRWGEDLIFNLYAFWYAAKIYVLDVPVYHYRIRTDSVSRAYCGREKVELGELRFSREVHTFLERFQLWEQFQIYYDYNMADSAGCVLLACGEDIHDFKGFCTAVRSIKRFCRREKYANAIRATPLTLMMGKKAKVRLWLMKHHMYITLVFAQRVFHFF